MVDRRGLGLLTVSHVVDDLYQGAVPALLPFLVLERGYSYAAATGITLAATVLSSVVQPAFGVLADRRPLTWLPAVGLLVAGVGIGLAGLGDSYWWTWAAVALSGLGVAAYHPAAARAARAAAGASAQGMSWFAVGGNAGLALGPVVVTPVLLAYGVAGTPLLALPALVTAAVLLALGRRARARPRSGSASGRTPERDDDWRSFGWLTGLVVIRSVLYFGVSSLVALYVIDRFGVPASAGSAALATFLAVGAVGTLAGGWLADRWGRVPAIRLGYAVAVPGLVLLVVAPSWPVAFAAAVLLGVGLYLPFSVQTTLGQELLPNRVGTASGVTLGLAVSAGGAVTPLFGVLADAHGLAWSLAALLPLPLLALLVSLRLPGPSASARAASPAAGGPRGSPPERAARHR
ncbi:MFS transporter [Geodermatophilus obscurus]|uniref:Major facilitator superfamily MFS_1 n=1 Tax=Geodermatophilus obscurus (strain ATCC 25078 / DSM 43160 / JCM 3152 / CCUG 61914 / KCC A-0152 / KCTC 9177 / NBRC 13315 / NRRL B-3577 / G-20) TaxID=526225 RepID=D2SAZ7_GEOOG|nr:MFS transporter [Geodermatophilus obscurus]ADB76032.1 major facilitator superfamily MFS_1 [Geodermatophilus obscurus DSM 43160]